MDIIYNIESIYSLYSFKNEKKEKQNIIYLQDIIPNYINKQNYFPFYLTLFLEEPTRIIDNIFIGNIANASNWSIIRDYNFNNIINISSKIPNYFKNIENIYYVNITENNLLNNFDYHLENTLSSLSKDNTKTSFKNNFLFHSFGGTSVVYLIIIALLIVKYNFNLSKAINFLYKKNNNFNLEYNYYNFLKNKYK